MKNLILIIVLFAFMVNADATTNWPEKTLYDPTNSWSTGFKDLSSVSLSSNGQRLSATGSYDSPGLKIFDLFGNLSDSFNTSPLQCAVFSKDGSEIFSGSQDKKVQGWSLLTKSIERTYVGHKEFIWAVSISPDGSNLVSSGSHDNSIKVWSVFGGGLRGLSKTLGKTEVHPDFLPWVGPVVFLDSNRIVAGYSDGLRIWNIQTGSSSYINGKQDMIYSLAISPDGTLLASGGSQGLVCIWDSKTMQLLSTTSIPGGSVYAVTFITNDILAIGREYKMVQIYAWKVDKLLIQLNHGAFVVSVINTSRGLLTATGYPEGEIRLWDIEKLLPSPQPQQMFIWGRVKEAGR